MKKIVLLTNILTPYRIYFYDLLHDYYKQKGDEFFVLVMAKTEPDRSWIYDEYKRDYTILMKSFTISIRHIYLHYNIELKKKLKELNPDVVVCGGGYLLPSVKKTLKIKKKLGFKCIYWSESHLYENKGYKKFVIMYREYVRSKTLPKFDGFWFAGKLSKEFLVKYVGNNKEYIFVPNLIDSSLYDNVNKFSIDYKNSLMDKYNIINKRVLLISARLTPVKGVLEFLELFKMIDYSKCELLIAGDGELKNDIFDFINSNNLPARLLGYVSQIEMLDLYSIASILVLPSLSDPNPLTVIEACWCKKPLFVSEHVGNYPEAVDSNGFVFSYMETNDAINKLNYLISLSDEELLKLGEKSYRIANNIYNENKMVAEIAEKTKGDII